MTEKQRETAVHSQMQSCRLQAQQRCTSMLSSNSSEVGCTNDTISNNDINNIYLTLFEIRCQRPVKLFYIILTYITLNSCAISREKGGGGGTAMAVTLYTFKLSNLIQLILIVLTSRFLYIFLSYLCVGSRQRLIIILLYRVACILELNQFN